MKKQITFFAIIFIVALTFSSCRKEYNCTCLVTDSSGTQNSYSTNITSSKKNAQRDCEASAPESDFGKTCTLD